MLGLVGPVIAFGLIAKRVLTYVFLAWVTVWVTSCSSRTSQVRVHHHGGSQEQRELAERAMDEHEKAWPDHPVTELHVWHEKAEVTCHGVTGAAVYCAPRIHHGNAPGLPHLQHEWGHAAGLVHGDARMAELDRKGAEIARAVCE